MSKTTAIRQYVAGWTTQKLFDVLAFCEDGKMDANEPCNCLIGVGSYPVLHVSWNDCAGSGHYTTEKNASATARLAELEYLVLCYCNADGSFSNNQQNCDRVLAEILREEITRRELTEAVSIAESEGMPVCA